MQQLSTCAASILVGCALLNGRPGQAQTPGALDASFGSGGKVFTAFTSPPGTDYAHAVLQQTDGRLVVAGGGANGLELARYTSAGVLDPSFGTGGLVVSNLGSSPPSAVYPNGSSAAAYALSIVQQPATGKLLVAGRRGYEFLLARYNTNGTLDTSFGPSSNGLVTGPGANLGNAFRKVVITASGQLLAVGAANGLNSTYTIVRRFSADGIADNTYGSGGYAFPGGSNFTPITALLDASGNLVLGGYTLQSNGTRSNALLRVLPGGSVDSSFGTQGMATITANAPGGYAFTLCGLAQQPDGKLVMGGGMVLSRVSATGSPDATFGTNGVVTTSFYINNVALQSDGNVLLAGKLTATTSNNDFTVARYTSAGLPDATFATAGMLVFSEDAQDTLDEALLQTDGKLVAVGMAGAAGGVGPSRFAMCRVHTGVLLAAAQPTTAAPALVTYPNPATEVLQLEQANLPAGTQVVTFRLCDALGRQLRTVEAVNQGGKASATISLSGLAPGGYWLSGVGIGPARPVLVR